MNKHFLIKIVITSALVSCNTVSKLANGTLKTDLGQSNSEVAARFERYKAKQSHCSFDAAADYRVILAGFGPFSGRPINTSGLIAHNFVDFQNNRINTPIIPTLTTNDHDGIAKQGQVAIAGKHISICAVTASVIWDLAGAIYLYEASIFKPNLIIMSGMDGKNNYVGTWESGTKNVAAGLSGYEHDGSSSEVTPSTDGQDLIPIVPGSAATLDMTWDPVALTGMANPLLRRDLQTFTTRNAVGHTPGTYLCNNVSYVVIAGLTGVEIPLAGGLLPIRIQNLSDTKAGFFHYPWLSPQDGEAVRAWSNVMAGAIKQILEL